MSREGAHRLRARQPGGLFAALWDRMLEPDDQISEGHSAPFTDGDLARLLGTHFRRQRGDFAAVGKRPAAPSPGRRTWRL